MQVNRRNRKSRLYIAPAAWSLHIYIHNPRFTKWKEKEKKEDSFTLLTGVKIIGYM